MTNINFIVTEFLVGVCMTSCPRCSSNAKLTGKEWKYGPFHVKQYECIGYENVVMEYYRNSKPHYS